MKEGLFRTRWSMLKVTVMIAAKTQRLITIENLLELIKEIEDDTTTGGDLNL